jgi:hypothetical protein
MDWQKTHYLGNGLVRTTHYQGGRVIAVTWLGRAA